VGGDPENSQALVGVVSFGTTAGHVLAGNAARSSLSPHAFMLIVTAQQAFKW
jgi:hypothetical protein